jgi:hypothetical protein
MLPPSTNLKTEPTCTSKTSNTSTLLNSPTTELTSRKFLIHGRRIKLLEDNGIMIS